jgi:hypothetical protein
VDELIKITPSFILFSAYPSRTVCLDKVWCFELETTLNSSTHIVIVRYDANTADANKQRAENALAWMMYNNDTIQGMSE